MWHCSFLLFFLRFPGAAWLQPLVLSIVRVHLLWRSKGQKKLGTKFTFIEHLGCFHLHWSWCLFVNRRLAASGKHNQPGKAWTAPFLGIEDTFEVDSKSKVLWTKRLYLQNPSKFALFEHVWRHDTTCGYIACDYSFSFETKCLSSFFRPLVSSTIQEIKASEVQPGWTFPPAFGDEKGFGVEPSNVRSREAAEVTPQWIWSTYTSTLNQNHFKIWITISKYWIPSDSGMNLLGASWNACSQENNLDFGHRTCPSRHADVSRLLIRIRWATTCAFNSWLPLKRNTPPRWNF